MILYVSLYILMLAYILNVSKRSLHMLQQNLYNENNRYLKWVHKNYKISILNITILAIIASLLLYNNSTIIGLFGLIVICIIYIFGYLNEQNISRINQNKKPLVYTARVKRLIITHIVVYLVPLLLYSIVESPVFITISTVLAGFGFYTTYLCLLINYPVEKLVYRHFETMAKDKLKSMKDLKIIGITGSYGKTSCKNVLSDILSIKYSTLPTPKSLNTFNGLMITINNNLSKFDEVFIAEMGAYVEGEIGRLCDLVNPKYGIITSIGLAHLETFGSEQAITRGKMELIEHLPVDGIGVLNKDDENQVKYKRKNKCKILWIGIENSDVDVHASNIKINGLKTTFDVTFKGDNKKYKFETKLLGKHNVYNILSALALGYEFGISISDLQLAVKRANSVEHRLSIRKFNRFYQIDDAYNSNPVGAKGALDVLNLVDGYKVVVTPGMIELGDKEYELNKIFGTQIAEVADLVILIGEKQTKPIYEGLIESGYPKGNIKVLTDVRESYNLINSLSEDNIYALYENDLPDTYNE